MEMGNSNHCFADKMPQMMARHDHFYLRWDFYRHAQVDWLISLVSLEKISGRCRVIFLGVASCIPH